MRLRSILTAVALTVVIQPLTSTNALGSTNHSWKAGITVNRHRVVSHSTLPHCDGEMAETGPLPCTWNIGRPFDGNGLGLAFVADRHNRAHFVWNGTPHRKGYRWVNREWADALAEGGDGAHPDRRNWQACIINVGPTTVIRCPDGSKFTS